MSSTYLNTNHFNSQNAISKLDVDLIEDARRNTIHRLQALATRAMEQHFAHPHPWGTVSKPGPGYPLTALAYKLTRVGFRDGISVWEWDAVERVWEWVENREGLNHPLVALKPIIDLDTLHRQARHYQRPLPPPIQPKPGDFWISLR